MAGTFRFPPGETGGPEEFPAGPAVLARAYARQRLCAYIEDPMASRLVLRALTSDGADNDIQPVREDFAHSFHRLVELIRAGQVAGHLRADLNPALLALLINAGNVFYAQTRPLLRHFTDPPYMRDHGIGLIGSPKTVAQKLRAYAQEGLFNVLLGEFNFGFLGEEQVMRSIRLFGEEVIPQLRDFEPY